MRSIVATTVLLCIASSAASQTLLADIDATPTTPVTLSVAGPVTVGSSLYWIDRGIGGAVLLWCSDGTAAGTRVVREFDGGGVASLVALGQRVVLGVPGVPDGTLWSSDGTAAGTVAVAARVASKWVGAAVVVPLVSMGGHVYFIGIDDAHGQELWKTDGTPAGTGLVADVNPGPANGFGGSTSDARLGSGNGLVYFGATDGVLGEELWKSDGTAVGTSMVANLRTGSQSSQPGDFVELGGRTLFVAEETSSGRELLSTQGTAATTGVVRDIWPGTRWGVRAPDTLSRAGGKVYFVAHDGVTGDELWQSDGTLAGTALVADILPGSFGAQPRSLTPFGARLVFDASDGSGHDPWITDGSPAGTTRLRNGPAGFRAFAELGGRVYWFELGAPATLVESDGTPAGTTAAPVASTVEARWLGVVGGQLLFRTADGSQLWATTGVASAPRLVATLYPPRTADSITSFSNPSNAVSKRYRGNVFFAAAEPTSGNEPWRTDGTPAGTALFADLVPGAGSSRPGGFTNLDERYLLFLSSTGGWSASAPGAPPTPIPLPSVFLLRSMRGGAAVAPFPVLGKVDLWFEDGDLGTPLELLTSGTVTVSVVADTRAHAFLATQDVSRGTHKLWRSDGTTAGTRVVVPSVFGRLFYGAAIADDEILFVVDSGNPVLWTSDGTATGTVAITTLPGTIADVSDFVALGDRVVFRLANHPTFGSEPWVSDGTAAGTHVLADLVPGIASSSPDDVTVAGDRAYFTAFDLARGRELWITDGTAAGTVLVADIDPGIGSSSPRDIRSLDTGARVVFAATTGDAGREPWISDGTAAGTVRIADVWPGPHGSDPRDLRALGQSVFAAAVGATVGREPWRIDLSVPVARSFGRGGRGAGGARPELFALGEPAVGNAGFGVGVRDAAPAASAGLLLSLSRADLELAPDCVLHAAPPPLLSLPLTTGGTGVGSAVLPIPNVVGLIGVELYAQSAVVDAAGCFRNLINVSDAMRMVVGQ